MNNMLSENYTEITSDLQDGAGELLNIIFGHAKRVLNTQGYEIQKAIPSIIRGQNLEAKHLTSNPVIVLPFLTDKGEFYIEICSETASMK
jgi:chemotaxis protein CheX